MQKQICASFFTLILLVSAGIAWNFWLPNAKKFYSHSDTAMNNVDFYAYYSAGERSLRGQNPYLDLSVNPYIYPPTFLPVYRAFARVPYPQARAIWVFGMLAFFAVTAAAWVRSYDAPYRYPLAALIALITFTSSPLLLHIDQGQIDLLVSGIAVLSFIAHRRSWIFLSAFLLAAGTLIKVNPAILLIYFVILRADIKYLAWYGASLVMLAALSLAAVPFDLYVFYAREVLPRISNGAPYFFNQSLIRLIPAAAPGFVPKLVSAAGFAGFIAFTVWLRKKHGFLLNAPFGSETLFLMNILVMLLFSAIAWYMAYVWVILPAALLLLKALLEDDRRTVAAVACGIVLINARPFNFPVFNSLAMIGNAILLAFLAASLFSRPGRLPTASVKDTM